MVLARGGSAVIDCRINETRNLDSS